MKLPHRFSKLFERNEVEGRVECDETGFTILDGDGVVARICWSEVHEIFAFKADRGMWDDICLGFAIDEEGAFYTVTEEFVGYKQLLGELERRFPGIVKDWFSKVAFPAFATNRRTLWQRSRAG